MSKQRNRSKNNRTDSPPQKPCQSAHQRPQRPAKTVQKTQNSSKTPTNQPKIGSKAFRDLQKEWYGRLKREGFKDLERPMPDGSTDSWLHGQSMHDLAKQYSPETQLYYERLRAYLTHRPHWHEDAFYRFAGRLHAKGVSYREICEIARAKGIKPNANKWHVFKAVEALRPLAERWNRTSVKGCDYVPDIGTDFAEEQD